MKRSFVDTNIFVETFVRKGQKSDRAYKLLNENSGLCTTSLVISEIEWVMRAGYAVAKKDIIRCIGKILTSDIVIDNRKLLLRTLNFYEANNVDWTDCLNMFAMKDQNVAEVYSYDKGLNRFDWIQRLEP